MFYDHPDIMYENPPPPSDYESEEEVDPPVFIFPEIYKYSNCIKIDPRMIPVGVFDFTKPQVEDLTPRSIEAAENIEIIEDSTKVKHSKVNETVKTTRGDKSIKSRKSSEYVKRRKKREYRKNTESREEKEYTESREEKEKTESRKKREYTESREEKEYTESREEREYTESRKEREYTESRKEREYTESRKEREYTESRKEREYTESRKEREYTENRDNSKYEKGRTDREYGISREDKYYAKGRKESEPAENTRDCDSVQITKTGRNIREEEFVEVKQERKQAESFVAKYRDYHCDICHIELNGPSNYHSHLIGKKHKKAEKQILEMQAHRSGVKLVVPEFETFPILPGRERIQLHDRESKMQAYCDNSELLIIGLDNVIEIMGYEEVKYFCDLCPATCSVNTLVNHIIGYRHQMSCLEKYYPETYNSYKDIKDRRTDREIKLKLKEAQRKFGKGKIRVFKDVMKSQMNLELYDPAFPTTSRQDLDVQPEKYTQTSKRTGEPTATDEQFLSREFGDFFCKICDAHMNNYLIWENHVRGKRHIKNKKSTFVGLPVPSSFREVPEDTISHLEEMVADCEGIIVGLNFIQENRSENGDSYTCFLCGSSCSSKEILDHLYQMKHKEKYLEKLYADGHDNSINHIKQLDISKASKEALIDDECLNMLKVHKKGKPIINEVQ